MIGVIKHGSFLLPKVGKSLLLNMSNKIFILQGIWKNTPHKQSAVQKTIEPEVQVPTEVLKNKIVLQSYSLQDVAHEHRVHAHMHQRK